MSAIRLSIVRRLSMVLLLSTLLTLLTGTLRGVQSAGAATTSTVSGVEVVLAESARDAQSPKRAVAYCPSNKRVIGGGGAVTQTTIDDPVTQNPALTELRPVYRYGGGTRDAYVVTAAETPPGITEEWGVLAYAVCADPLPGLHIVSASTALSSSSVQATAASCSGEWVIGTGGRISTSSGRVVLQVARPSHPGDIARVQAHEVPTGYTGNWSVTAYAICVPTKPNGYEVVFGESQSRLSQDIKHAFAYCPSGKQLLSSGAAISNTAPGHVSLQAISPISISRYQGYQLTVARAVENTPTSLNWDFIVATAICAY